MCPQKSREQFAEFMGLLPRHVYVDRLYHPIKAKDEHETFFSPYGVKNGEINEIKKRVGPYTLARIEEDAKGYDFIFVKDFRDINISHAYAMIAVGESIGVLSPQYNPLKVVSFYGSFSLRDERNATSNMSSSFDCIVPHHWDERDQWKTALMKNEFPLRIVNFRGKKLFFPAFGEVLDGELTLPEQQGDFGEYFKM
jgi:hypothetical protein